ncbi:MAG TPA: right-handed parallel beta-helix repeat-containing protein [Pirellulales bacterium]|nr:right-handed parallel beta-helix repeat-containing protein [Pirellulales bacterium]
MRMTPVFLAFILSALCGVTRGEDLFVDNLHGDDARTGRTQLADVTLSGPVRSLTRALELARPGDRVMMADTGVPYRESVTLSGGRNNGLGSEPFVIEGNGAVLDGSLPVPPRAWEHFQGDVFRFRPPRMAFAQLFLNGPPVDRRYLKSTLGRLPDLAAGQWCLADGWIYFRVEPQTLPDDYPLQYAALTVGITLYEVHDVVIRNLTVQGFQLDGINAHDCAKDCQLIGVIARGNGRAGIAVGGASNVRIKTCLLSDNGDEQILTEGPSVTSIEGTEIDAASAPALQRKEGTVFVEGERVEKTTIDQLPASANP